jgi:hypothetical protein
MAKQSALFLPAAINNSSYGLAIGDTTVSKLLFTAGSNDSDVLAIVATSNDSATVNLQVFRTSGGTDYLLGTVRILTLSGTDGASSAIDVLNSTAFAGLPLNSAGKRYIPLKSGDTIRIAPVVTMTTGKVCNVTAFGQDY